MMNRLLFTALFAALLPWAAQAQVEKQVEVTKAYVPSVSDAAKLAAKPDMTDTTRMRPEIDYTITPLSLRTTLALRPIRPATVTYWEFNRPLPFYLKVGAGYPANSVLDFYASTQNPGTGYVVGYVNHQGRYADIRNDFGVKNNALQLYNRAGVAAGKYLGRHVLEGDLSYDNRLYHRYGSRYLEHPAVDLQPGLGDRIDFGDAALNLRLGDDFEDLSRVNFEVALRGDLFFDHSKKADYDGAMQTTLGGDARIAKAFGRHRLSLAAGYEWIKGTKAISDYNRQTIRAALRYGIHGDVIRFDAGADYYHVTTTDAVPGSERESEDFVIPYLHLNLDLGAKGLQPFLELDGGVEGNDYRTLSLDNPYVAVPSTLNRSSVTYDARLGVGGSMWKDRFSYRVYAGISIRDNHRYWYNERTVFALSENSEAEPVPLSFLPVLSRQTVTSFNGEVEYRPVSTLRLMMGVHGYLYNDSSIYDRGEPSIEANLGVKYEGRRIAFGAEGRFTGARSWTTIYNRFGSNEHSEVTDFEAPAVIDVRVNFDWKVTGRVTLFVEGRNLANAPMYRYAWLPEYGASFTAGVKMNF